MTELDLKEFLAEEWGMRGGYVIAAYNGMTTVRRVTGDMLLIGLEAFVSGREPMAPGAA